MEWRQTTVPKNLHRWRFKKKMVTRLESQRSSSARISDVRVYREKTATKLFPALCQSLSSLRKWAGSPGGTGSPERVAGGGMSPLAPPV